MSHIEAFLASMRMDLTVTGYATYDDLMTYMHGRAAVIGLQMVPILGPVVAREVAEPYAADLGIAFQLTTSCATSARTSVAAGSTCRSRTSTPSG